MNSKIITAMTVIVVAMIALCMMVSAEVMPIKKFVNTDKGNYALRENGDFVFAPKSTDVPRVVMSEVADFKLDSDKIRILNKKGDYHASEYISYNETSDEIQFDLVDSNIKSIVYDSSYMYINNDDELFCGETKIGDNVVNTAGTIGLDPYTTMGSFVKRNGELWIWVYENKQYKTKKVMEDITDAKLGDSQPFGDIIFDNNYTVRLFARSSDNSLWYIEVKYEESMENTSFMPVKIANDVKDYCIYAYLTNDNNLYSTYNTPTSPYLFYNNVTDIITYEKNNSYVYLYFVYSSSYANNVLQSVSLYTGSSSWGSLNRYVTDNYSVEANSRIINRYSTYIVKDGVLQKYYSNGSNTETIDTDVVKVIDGAKGYYIKNDGAIYQAKKSLPISYKGITLFFNGNKVPLKSALRYSDGRTFYPFRDCLEAMGASVLWDGTTQTAIGQLNGKKIEFVIGSQEYKVNGEPRSMDTAAFIDNSIGRTYIPIRFAAEGLGFNVKWEGGKSEDTITIE